MVQGAELVTVSSHFFQIPLDTTQISQSNLNIEEKKRSNPLKWNGQFSPQLVEILLRTYSSSRDHIFDPFTGSGTVLLEAGVLGLSAQGTEINPAAFILSSTYRFINIVPSERRSHLDQISENIWQKLQPSIFFSSHEQNFLLDALKSLLIEINEPLEKVLFQLLIVLLDIDNQNLTNQRIQKVWRKIVEHILQLPYSSSLIKVSNSDAKSTSIENDWADLVVTSPPYINVFNYHQQYRASLEVLNYNLLIVAKSEIGSNRKHRGNRFLTVIQYCLDMALVLNELRRISVDGGRWIIIVGRESNVRGVPFYNGQIVTEVAHQVIDQNLVLKQERNFRNRFGQSIFEDILHFQVDKQVAQIFTLEKARGVAYLALEEAYNRDKNDTRQDIRQAIEEIQNVLPSPILDRNTILRR